MDRGHDRILRLWTFTLPVLFTFFFLIYPLALLLSRFRPGDILEIALENSGVVKFTFFQAFLSATLVVLIGIPLARILARRRLPSYMASSLNVLSKVPFVVPGISMALGFMIFLGRRGLLNTLLSPLGLKVDILYTFEAVLLGHVFYNVPVVVYVVGTLWERLDGSLLEAAEMDGAGELKSLFLVELPILLPAIASSFLMAFTYCFTSFAVVLILGGVRYSTIEVSIYTYLKVLLDFRTALSLTIFQTLFLAFVALIRYSLDRRVHFQAGEPLKRDMKPLDWLYLIFVTVIVIVPLILSVLGGVLKRGSWGFTLEGFEYLFKGTWSSVLGVPMHRVLRDTFIIALMSSVVSTVVSLLSSRISIRIPSFSLLPYLPTTISTVTLAMGYVILGMRMPIGEIPLISMLHAVISLPMTHVILESSWRRIDPSIEESAKVDGAGVFRTFFSVQLPLMWRGLARAMTLAFTVSMGDLSGVMTLSRRTVTISSAIYRLFASRHVKEALSLNTLMMIVVISIFFIGERLGRD